MIKLNVIISLLTGGTETLIAELMLRLRNNNVKAEVADFNAIESPLMDRLIDNGVFIHRFAPECYNSYSSSNLFKMHKLINNGKFDIVHAHNTACQLFGTLCHFPKSGKSFTTEHNTSKRSRGYGLMKYVDRLIYNL